MDQKCNLIVMFDSFDLCLALDCVKKIYENNSCIVCDKAAEEFRRFLCGHTACKACAGYCFYCLGAPEKTTSFIDNVSKQRARNASVLLKAFEKAFNVDVFKHQRMSEQMKLEKYIFPECIQAPRKYMNKRKSLIAKSKNKDNRITILPGEIIANTGSRMTNSITSVQQWLIKNNKNALKDRNVNKKDENDESGIVIDESVIDCSQITEDKDKQALLAVYEADKNDERFDSMQTIDNEYSEDNDSTLDHPKILKDEYKVPFIKKSKFTESCSVCDNNSTIINTSTINTFGHNNSIQITISYDNQSIKPNKFGLNNSLHGHSVSVQTDISGFSDLTKNSNPKDLSLQGSCEIKSICSNIHVPSQDVFTYEELYKNNNADTTNFNTKTATKSVVINESDSDEGAVAEVTILEVSAQVHNIERPVLSDITYIDSHEERQRRQRRRPRRLTPDSSNSSEKENIPNKRQKKSKSGKKLKK